MMRDGTISKLIITNRVIVRLSNGLPVCCRRSRMTGEIWGKYMNSTSAIVIIADARITAVVPIFTRLNVAVVWCLIKQAPRRLNWHYLNGYPFSGANWTAGRSATHGRLNCYHRRHLPLSNECCRLSSLASAARTISRRKRKKSFIEGLIKWTLVCCWDLN